MSKGEKVILVTGAARGIGLEICRQLADRGHTVLLGAAATGLGARPGVIVPLHLDISRDTDAWAARDAVEDQFGRLDVLIHNAAIMDHQNLPDLDEGDFRRILETNFFGALNLTRVLLPVLQKSADPRIIHVSSGMGALESMSGTGNVGYRFSKWALNGLTMLSAAGFKSMGIKVNAMCPGWVRTDMGGAKAPRGVEQGADTAVWLATTDESFSGKFFRDRREIPW